ncbi:hypothetical protein [Rugamonas sp.]|uniref:hypothetical protein n=1 Tax=Rugamonas sp. TaxID=1926287 RepID=UPI0025FBE314|nr:hypothetical protein [Rugamonas sp.]
MNEYEALFEEIVERTKSKSLHWRQLNRRDNTEIILNAHLVLRQFTADFARGKYHFTLLLIEKKEDDALFDPLFQISPRQNSEPEILVLDDGELITTLTDSIIDRWAMLRLLDLVETRSDKVRKLFDLNA